MSHVISEEEYAQVGCQLAPSVIEQDLGSPLSHLISHSIDAERRSLFLFLRFSFLLFLTQEQGCEPQCGPVITTSLGSTLYHEQRHYP